MAEAAVRVPGTPIWVDLGSPDLEASKAFYGSLFGWEASTPPGGEPYTIFTLQGKMVAGLGPAAAGQPPAWSTYVATDDADATARAVRDAGGRVLMDPMDVMDVGRMAVFTDPTGAAISVWQPRQHHGAEIFNEPNTYCWSELETRDMDVARDFYGKVFAWGSETHPMGPGGGYTEWKIDGKTIAGGMQMTDEFPPSVPPHWLTYFAVEDCDAAVSRAQQLGASVLMPTMDIEPGRFAVLRDPQGAVFAMIQMKGGAH